MHGSCTKWMGNSSNLVWNHRGNFPKDPLWSERLKSPKMMNVLIPWWFKPWPFHPLVGGHDSPLKGSLNHPKKGTKNCQVSPYTYHFEVSKAGIFPLRSQFTLQFAVIFCVNLPEPPKQLGPLGLSGAIKWLTRCENKHKGWIAHDGSMGLVYLPTWMVDFYGKCR